ncbi:uncharacterized protein LOC133522999 isoform X2 [Cydia pomonella]|uniref:uncharacterized protein LOC133522999 isoform X2 n=1 Tax=Cydia pomonella TaxID=82600 RepID=UPI002ADE5968|nr:uncharacterized protein LOC133522999 isoform X2 [Cydia pomonella]
MAVGKVEPFDIHKGSWEAYKDRVEQYFVVNDVKEDRKVPLLITLMGAEAYELLVTLCTPAKPSTLKYDQIQQLLADHLQPTPSVLAERYKFRQRKQTKSESVADYLADLKKLSRFCDFGTWLDESVRDQFVCGLHSESIRLRLFTEKDLKLKTATDLAVAMEAAEFNAAEVARKNNPSGERETAGCYAISEATGASGMLWARARGNTRAAASRAEGTRGGATTSGSGRAWPSGPSGQRRYGGAGVTLTAAPRSKEGHGQLCSVCGRDHSSESCKFKLYSCRVCNQEGHLKKMCPRLSRSVGHHYVITETGNHGNQSIPEDDLEFQI